MMLKHDIEISEREFLLAQFRTLDHLLKDKEFTEPLTKESLCAWVSEWLKSYSDFLKQNELIKKEQQYQFKCWAYETQTAVDTYHNHK